MSNSKDQESARVALAQALNLKTVNDAVYNGVSHAPTHIFGSNSPYYEKDLTLPGHDSDAAQAAFDDLAAAGKPVDFTIYTASIQDASRVADSVQTQLSEFKNVKAKVKALTS